MKTCQWCKKDLPTKKRKFCCNKCKDKYHNFHNPRGYGLRFAEEKEVVGREQQ